MIAIHRPRLFLLEAGNSFGLLADYCRSLGLTVNKISIKPGNGVSLAPFAYAHLLLQASPDELVTDESALPDIDTADDGDEKRDILGEMEIAARLMVTGGEAAEEAHMTRADRGMLREAILAAAHTSFDASRQMLPET
ncbi:conjugative transfer ATPase%2C PFL_4706 family [Yersinia aldovae]|nr:conjugative transfer ATPase%2C PFL_4706 family [Yersinia aldovae]